MRELADAGRIRRFMRSLGRSADAAGACYLTGGTTAVLLGWRDSTIDVDIRLVPETELLLRTIQRLKDELRVNVELASPLDFIPVPPGWEERSVFVVQEGRLAFYHFDLVAQALSKVERAHAQDLADVRTLLERKLVDPEDARSYFARMEPELFRFPAIDASAYRERVDEIFGARG